mgnify:CR=1 FL=1
MEFFTAFFEAIGSGLGTFAPDFGTAFINLFITIFCTFTEAEGIYTVTGPNVLGYTAIASVVIAITYKAVPTVLGAISRKLKSRKSRARA